MTYKDIRMPRFEALGPKTFQLPCSTSLNIFFETNALKVFETWG
jgi:hypothetical protein